MTKWLHSPIKYF